MSIINDAKEIADLIKKIGDVELYRKIIELEGEIIELTNLKRESDAEIERLQELLDTKEKMLFKKPFYFMGEDPVPYCPKCWELDKVTVHLKGPDEDFNRFDCPNCQGFFYMER